MTLQTSLSPRYGRESGISPIKLTVGEDLPKKMRSHRRNISPKLIENAKAEFFRLKQYIYVDSEYHT